MKENITPQHEWEVTIKHDGWVETFSDSEPHEYPIPVEQIRAAVHLKYIQLREKFRDEIVSGALFSISMMAEHEDNCLLYTSPSPRD